MGRLSGFFLALFLLSGYYYLPKLKGKILVFFAPAIDAQDLQDFSAKVQLQKEKLLHFENQLCLALDPCLASTRTGRAEEVVEICDRAAMKISSLQVPNELPEVIRQNLEIYRNSSYFSAGLMARRWWSKQMNKSLQSNVTFLNSYEIDTCGFQSIPQKIRRLYGFDMESRTRLVHCAEIKELASVVKVPDESSRMPASPQR